MARAPIGEIARGEGALSVVDGLDVGEIRATVMATVNPAARLPLVAKELGAKLIEINPEETTLTRWCDITLNGPSGELLPLLLKRLKNGGSAEPGNPA